MDITARLESNSGEVRPPQWAAVDHYTDLLLEHDQMAGAFDDLAAIPELWTEDMTEWARLHRWAIPIVQRALAAEVLRTTKGDT